MQQTDGTSSIGLHKAVLNEIDDLLRQLKPDATAPRVASTMKQVVDLVAPIHDDLAKRIEALQRHARWDTFTIAFYGETNAGKSTIIETLRILLQERTKTEARSAFRVKEAEFGISEASLAARAESIEVSRATLDAQREQVAERKAQLDADRDALQQELNGLRLAIEAKKRAASLWQKLVWLFSKLPEQLEFARTGQQQRELVVAHEVERARLDAQLDNAQTALQSLEAQQAKAHAMLDSLVPFADGQIIGTGRSDYTLDAHGYEFDANGQRFELLDVPGIEGKEARVIDSILGAVKAAHAVFYVTGKPSAPQTGDKDGQGTLEKIREHLGDQTEVWSIFNKRITNPIQLEKGDLLNQGERASLAVLDETMREHLGNNYQRYIALSAQPAFLAAADCLVPGSDAARGREKFLAKASPADVLARSGFQSFLDWLSRGMVTDSDARIRASNVHKVRSAVRTAAGTIALIQRDKVAPLAADVQRDWAHVSEQLELAVSALGPALQTHADAAIRTFETRVREQIYERIKDGIDNDDVKDALSAAMRREQAKLESALPTLMERELARFQRDVSDTLERFQRRIEELQDAYRSIDTPTLGSFELNMKFDSGVNYISLIAALAGGLMMIWNPAGWVSLAIGGVTLVVSIAKAVWGFFDSDYKKSQQRKAANENIGRVVGRMEDAMKSSCDKAMESVKTRIDEIAAEVERSVNQVAQINSTLIRVSANLAQLSTTISETEAV
ncbi:GTPase Der [Caballeronia telluris]|uniref:GTPase Der n=1 Tax=Caballeronia telluris TaxID=326475 RepID=A0A158FJ11_9BURK|nr:GTPase Der [Caballeronia telluris]